jgi:hypothetical protein
VGDAIFVCRAIDEPGIARVECCIRNALRKPFDKLRTGAQRQKDATFDYRAGPG